MLSYKIQIQKYYLLLVLSGSFGYAMARQQDEEKAFSLLNSISQRSFRATFLYTNRSELDDSLVPFEEGGQIVIYGNKYRLMLPEQEVINNGQTVWTYLKEANEVQITDYDSQQGATATLWTILANYRRHYTLGSFDTHQTNGQNQDSIKLLAKDVENSLAVINITVDRATKYIKFVEVIDNNQTLHAFLITDFEYDLKFDKAFFSFNADEHPGVEVIDMR